LYPKRRNSRKTGYFAPFLREFSGSPQIISGLTSDNFRKIVKFLIFFNKPTKIAPLDRVLQPPTLNPHFCHKPPAPTNTTHSRLPQQLRKVRRNRDMALQVANHEEAEISRICVVKAGLVVPLIPAAGNLCTQLAPGPHPAGFPAAVLDSQQFRSINTSQTYQNPGSLEPLLNPERHAKLWNCMGIQNYQAHSATGDMESGLKTAYHNTVTDMTLVQGFGG
jgi:hypothetical protein